MKTELTHYDVAIRLFIPNKLDVNDVLSSISKFLKEKFDTNIDIEKLKTGPYVPYDQLKNVVSYNNGNNGQTTYTDRPIPKGSTIEGR